MKLANPVTIPLIFCFGMFFRHINISFTLSHDLLACWIYLLDECYWMTKGQYIDIRFEERVFEAKIKTKCWGALRLYFFLKQVKFILIVLSSSNNTQLIENFDIYIIDDSIYSLYWMTKEHPIMINQRDNNGIW